MITFPFLHTLLFALFSRGLSPNSHPNSLLNMLTNEVFNLALNESILKLSELLLSVLVDLWDCSRAVLKYVPTHTAGIPSTPSFNVEPPYMLHFLFSLVCSHIFGGAQSSGANFMKLNTCLKRYSFYYILEWQFLVGNNFSSEFLRHCNVVLKLPELLLRSPRLLIDLIFECLCATCADLPQQKL